MIPSVQYPVLKVPACGDGPAAFRLPPFRRSARGSTLPERLGAVKNFFESFFPALGRSASPPVPVRPCLRAGMYITHNPEAAQWVIFQFLDTPQFLHIYSIDLFLVEIDV